VILQGLEYTRTIQVLGQRDPQMRIVKLAKVLGLCRILRPDLPSFDRERRLSKSSPFHQYLRCDQCQIQGICAQSFLCKKTMYV
jgi:hypothetical protein